MSGSSNNGRHFARKKQTDKGTSEKIVKGGREGGEEGIGSRDLRREKEKEKDTQIKIIALNQLARRKKDGRKGQVCL